MEIKYNIDIKNEAIKENLKRLTNQIYKLLPNREEGMDWTKPLSTIIEEFTGMNELFLDYHEIFFSLLCKLEGLFLLKEQDEFLFFRKTIFECLSLVNKLGGLVCP
jgi:hypothetical protein